MFLENLQNYVGEYNVEKDNIYINYIEIYLCS